MTMKEGIKAMSEDHLIEKFSEILEEEKKIRHILVYVINDTANFFI